VQKIECVNHCIKNYSKHLHRIKKDTKSVALETRKLLTNQRIKDLTRNAQKAIYANAHGDISQLKHDLQNSVPCSFGNHSKCQTYLCNHVGDTASDNMSQLVSSGGHHPIFGSLNLIVIKSSQLIDNETNNRAELFMSLLARFNMGKRLNLIQRDGFQMRSYLSALRYNVDQSWHHKSWKQYFSCNALVKTILRTTSSTCTAAMEYGKKNECVAVLKFQEKTGKTVERAGLYIDVDHGFLGASPDGNI
ncbi:hypothetical protein ILUMI_16322, partial [Ignelater luminosus]